MGGQSEVPCFNWVVLCTAKFLKIFIYFNLFKNLSF